MRNRLILAFILSVISYGLVYAFDPSDYPQMTIKNVIMKVEREHNCEKGMNISPMGIPFSTVVVYTGKIRHISDTSKAYLQVVGTQKHISMLELFHYEIQVQDSDGRSY